jgi:hypothetical protein
LFETKGSGDRRILVKRMRATRRTRGLRSVEETFGKEGNGKFLNELGVIQY